LVTECKKIVKIDQDLTELQWRPPFRRPQPGCSDFNKMLSYRRETALQGTLVLAESGRLELRDNILLIL